MNTRWCHCGGSGSREWLLGHLRSTTGEGEGRGGGGWTEPMSSVCGEHDLTHHSGGGGKAVLCFVLFFQFADKCCCENNIEREINQKAENKRLTEPLNLLLFGESGA